MRYPFRRRNSRPLPVKLEVNRLLDELDERLRRWANNMLAENHEHCCPRYQDRGVTESDCSCYLTGPRGIVRKLKVEIDEKKK